MGRRSDIPLEPPVVKSPAVVPAVEDRSYLGYIAAALVSALAGGFLFAIWMPLAATGDAPASDRTPWLIQAHGWMQLQGWAGLFVAGMAVRLIPRFAGRRPIKRGITIPLLVLLVIPLVLRMAFQPWATGETADYAAIAIGVTSAVGMLGVAAVLAVTLAKGRKPREPWRYFAWAGTAWWAAWAVLMLVNIPQGGFAPGLLNIQDNDALLWVVMLGPIANFIFGVQSRSVPIFYGRKVPPLRVVLVPGIGLNFGAVLILRGALVGPNDHLIAGAGFILAASGLLMLPRLAGSVYGRAKRLRPRAQPAARFIIAANVSSMAAGALLLWAGFAIVVGDDNAAWGAPHTRDAARHLLGIGLITMLILGMARLIAPVFALERTEAGVPRLLERAPFWLLLAALALRTASALFAEPLGYESRMHTASLAGVFAWLAIAVFAFSVFRAARAEPRTKRALETLATKARNRHP